MYRSLIIGFGESFRSVCRRLEAAHRPGDVDGEDDDVQISTLRLFRRPDAGEQGRPFEEELRERALDELTDLLGMTASQTASRPWLDIFLLVDLGEEGPRSVLRDSIEELTDLVRQNFEAIFPSFRRSDRRRVRIVPVSIIAEHDASSRAPILETVRGVESWIADQHDPECEEDCLVDRFFVLDGVTPRGFVDKDDLLLQVSNVLELALFGDVRREEPFTSLLEYTGDHICATFSSAVWRIDVRDMHGRLAGRLAGEIVETLLESGSAAGANLDLAEHLLEDESLFEEYLERIQSLPEKTSRNQGPGAVVDLAGRYGELLDTCQERISNLQNEREGLEDQLGETSEGGNEGETSSGGGGVLGSAVGSLLLGGAIFALAFLGLSLALVASALISGGIALVGALALYWVLRNAPEPGSRSSARDDVSSTERRLEEVDQRLERLERLREAIRDQYVSMHALEEALRHLEPSEQLRRGESAVEEEPAVETTLPVRETVDDDALEEALFEAFLPVSEVETAALRFARDHVKPLDEWRSGDRLDPTELESFALEAFEPLLHEDLFRHREVREAVADPLRTFLESWCEGLPLFLDLQSRRQYDPDGFLSPFDQTLLVPEGLESLARSLIDELDSPIALVPDLGPGDRAQMLHTVVDIHPRAMPQPSTNESGDGAAEANGSSDGGEVTVSGGDHAPSEDEANDGKGTPDPQTTASR